MYISRHIEQKLAELAKQFKVILLVGARQVGKTTLFKNLFPETTIVTFDPIKDIENARKDPDSFLASKSIPIILDEVQFAPELLSSIKRAVDQKDSTGQYLLTGSQNLLLLRSVSESMAGRVCILRLEHLSFLEKNGLYQRSQNWLWHYLTSPHTFVQQSFSSIRQPLLHTIWRGSFPAAQSMKQETLSDFFESYLTTFIERDARVAAQLRSHEDFSNFFRICASMTAQEINNSHIGREIGVSNHAARDWLHLLEIAYQWRSIPAFGPRAIKRITSKRKGYMTDTGLACSLFGISDPASIMDAPIKGALFETWVVNYIHQLIAALPHKPRISHWRLQSGAEVDLILEMNNTLYPIEIKMGNTIARNQLRGLHSFREMFADRNIAPALVIYGGSQAYALDEKTFALPWNACLQ